MKDAVVVVRYRGVEMNGVGEMRLDVPVDALVRR